MSDENNEIKQSDSQPGDILDLLIAIVHNKVFPLVVVALFVLVAYPFVLIGPGSFFMKFLFMLILVPATIAFAVYVFAWCDAAPNMRETYRRFKKEFSPSDSDKDGSKGRGEEK